MTTSCLWPVDRQCFPAEMADARSPEDHARLTEAIDTAVYVLWSLTGRTFCLEEVTVRPCARDEQAPYGGMSAWLIDGRWFNIPGCGSWCTPHGTGVVALPGPARVVKAVYVDGVELDADSYRLDNANLLYRTSGGAWPMQDMSRPAGDNGTWSVTYLRGQDPPAGAALAVGRLALEFWNICTGGKCRLPKRWQTVTRQGVSVQRADPTDLLAQGYTGLPEIDTWIHAVNPHKLTAPPVVATPDYSSEVRW